MSEDHKPALNFPLQGNKTGRKPTGLVRELRRGDLCPQCRTGRLDYDGLLNLSCMNCGYAVGGCFT